MMVVGFVVSFFFFELRIVGVLGEILILVYLFWLVIGGAWFS